MKASIALSVLILAAAAGFGWQGHLRLAKARENHARLVAEAASLGISPGTADASGHVLVTKHAEREDQQAVAKQVAARLIAFAKEMEALEKKGGRPDEALQKRIIEMMEAMMSLNAAQMKTLVAEVRAAGDLKDETRQGIMSFAIMTLSDRHPQAALALFTESSDLLKNGGMGGHVISSALGRWAKDDPMGALKWVKENGAKFPDLVTEGTKHAVLSGAAAQDPKLALQLIGDLELKDSNQAMSLIARAAKTPEQRTATLSAIRDHLASVPDQAEREKQMNGAISSLAQSAVGNGFELGSQWISQAGFSPKELENVAGRIGYNIKLSETGQWVEWLGESLPAGMADKNIRTMVSRWTREDYQAAGTWLASAADGPAKQAAVRSYAETVAPYDPQSAAQWALTLPPGGARQQTLTRIHREWPKDDAAGAAVFAKEHGIKP